MNHEKYDELEVSADSLEYQFWSMGPKGLIKKQIYFESTNMVDVYNLSFGNRNDDGTIDDLTVSDNKDKNKILATVVSAIYDFTNKFPGKRIMFTGSTLPRTRLYRMAINLYLNVLEIDFEIFGIAKELESIVMLPFEKGVDYLGFIIKRKSINFNV
jgi:hypothetical protein